MILGSDSRSTADEEHSRAAVGMKCYETLTLVAMATFSPNGS